MSKSVLAVVAAVSALVVADAATAQSRSSSTTRSTTTTTQDGNTTRTETRTTTRSGEVSFDADAAFDALLGMAEGRGRADPDQGLRRRAEPARAEDAFGEWAVTDGGRDVGDCRFDMRENGFLGIRRIETHDCPSRLGRLSNWRIEHGELVLYRGAADNTGTRLMYVEGRFIGDGVTMRRLDDTGPGPEAGDHRGYDDGPRHGGRYGRSAEDYAGTWRHTEVTNTGMRRQCSVNLTTNPAFGRFAGSSSGCFGPLMFVSSWGYEDGEVVLYRAGGNAVAIFRGRGDRLTAPHEDGELVLYR
jgi:hypothetical protein